jgi:hypothetical protein
MTRVGLADPSNKNQAINRMSSDRRPRPEDKYLQKKLAELAEIESILAQRELELHTLRGGLLTFEKQYESAVGAKFAELDELRVRIAELTPSQTTPPPNADSSAARGVANSQSTDAQPSRVKARSRRKNATAKAATPSAPKPTSFVPTKSLKQLYRDIAKALHPDLADDDQSRVHRHEFMIRANVAYEANDEAKLLAVLEEWEHSPESVAGKGAGADLVRVIRKIERAELRLFAISREMEQLQTSGLFGMKMMSDEAGQFERNLLSEMTSRIDADIEVAKQMLSRLQQQQQPQLPQTPAEPGG